MTRTLISLLVLCFQCQAVELVVMLIDKTNRDEVKDRVGCAKIGMIIEVRKDGARYGTSEKPPYFSIVKFPGVKPEEFTKYLAPEMDATGTNVYRLRQHKIDMTTLGAASKTTADSLKEGTLQVSSASATSTANVVKTNIVDIKTGKLETATVKP